jgi:hypothetical protein
MPRPPIGKKAMTPAERQRRRRKKLRKEQSNDWRCRERLMLREKKARNYIPMPPGITFWRKVEVQTAEGPDTIFTPTTRPLAKCETDLDDDEIVALLTQLRDLAEKRGLDHEQPASAQS